ncbi:MFS general substrate transporter [Sodiomyces alkalinus F11]|uniref:MFS general substrate transporter n=1 Tax=Sodiomyces alkalinus (strain CBS 110278 / VKM F-3762 / F11) TaxID=1314773 RepID=A0A3N2PPE5_SODAK|nr:MFS general substrate transporter [Sodiomyces alkalinus F11]ROT36379.1 MFS general substrate transporter [Sodiomyces alkalinus F11]
MSGCGANHKTGGPEPVGSGRIPYWRLIVDQTGITPAVTNYNYPGSGTQDDPNPMEFSRRRKWFMTLVMAIATLAVALLSSAYTGGIIEIIQEFQIGQTVATLGVSLFVLGFAVGPLLWAPLSELFGRQVLFFGTYAAMTAFNAGCAGAQNAQTLIILRFFSGAFGSSPLTNAGGVIADIFPASERGLAMALFAVAPFLGPVLGPIIGGFLGMNAGWRWVMGFLAAFSGAVWILGTLFVPETYAPVLLRRRADKLSKMTGKCYVSRIDHESGRITLSESFKAALSRPWALLFKEPIVLLLSLYMAIVYGTLYMLFATFPIVYQHNRGWNQGIGGLAFLGIMVGMLFAMALAITGNKRFAKIAEQHGGFAPPETRLPAAMIGSIAMPVGLFWFAWTNGASVHWMASVAAGVPFGFGMVLVFLSLMNYLVDAYTIFAASVLAASSVIRSLFGTAFPLFTNYMYDDLGIHWASSIPAFLALACVPFPFLFYKYGAAIRARCKFASQSDAFMRKLHNAQQVEKEQELEPWRPSVEPIVGEGQSDSDTQAGSEADVEPIRAARTRSRASTRRRTSAIYEGNPFDIDRVHTRQSFGK